MRIFHLLVTGASLSLLSLHAGPMPPFESSLESPSLLEQPSSLDLLAEDDRMTSSANVEEELSFLDEEMDAFENEILALEEELKRDAELLGEPEQKVFAMEQPSQAVSSELPIVAFEEALSDEAVEQPREVVLVPLHKEVKEISAQPIVQEFSQPVDSIPQMEERAISSAESSARIISAAPERGRSAIGVPETQEPVATLDIEPSSGEKKNEPVQVDLQHAFAGSPIIYTILLGMSIFAFTVWLYSLLTLRKTGKVSISFVQEVKNKLNSNNFDGALSLCTQQENLISKMVSVGISARRHGLSVMIENMKIEGKRASIHFWQRIGLLNDIAVIAPMIGLLGTVLGMFYAFYDINRSIESIATLFDGLGISVGTTVAGLVVAILALMLHSLAKYQLVKVLTIVENEAQLLATVIDDRSAEYQKR